MATATSRIKSTWTHLLLHHVSWEEYEKFLAFAGNRTDLRANYCEGKLEIMAPLYRHDREKTVSGRLLERLCEELDRETIGGGSVTLKRELNKRGVEPDECYWIRNELHMRGKETLDLDVDPPPDLAIEIENTSMILDRLPIYAGIGVPEIWRWRDDGFEVLLLGEDGQYRPAASSPSFPELPIEGFSRFVAMCYDHSELTLVRQFVAWVRDGFPPLG